MSDKDQAAASPIAELLTMLLGGINLIKLEPKLGQSLGEAISEHAAAEHRKECPDCAAEYEAGMKEKADKASQDELAKGKAAFEATQRGAAKAETKKHTPIGYMVFVMKDGKMAPVKGSFETDRDIIEKKLAAFNTLPQITMLAMLAKAVGRDLMEAHEIRSVYA